MSEVKPPSNPLQLAPEEMRRLGYAIVDMLVEHERTLAGKPVTRVLDWKASRDKLGGGFPEKGRAPGEVLDQVGRDVFSTIMHVNHPRFFAFVPSPGGFVGAMADALAAGFNVFAGTWVEGSGPATVELATLDWLRQVCGLPETAGGLFLSGGSMANLTALAVARQVKLGEGDDAAVIYCSNQTHSSVERGVRVLGFQAGQFRKLATGDDYCLSIEALKAAVAEDRASGRRPFAVIANAGTTNTGAVDPLDTLADFCRDENLWLHADGAYGAAAALCERGKRILKGLDRVDSVSLDPHKWLFQPFEIGCLLVREAEQLKQTFQIMPDYLRDVHRQQGVNFADYGIQLTRSFRALKLWMSLQIFGVAAFRQAMEHGFNLAEAVEARLARNPNWEVLSPARMAIVSFRWAPAGHADAELNRINDTLASLLFTDATAAVTTTKLHGHVALRMCTINPRTTSADIDLTISRLEEIAGSLG
ncbi:MAG: aminotransferase class V-fold PLP-dependent enzyme [bacterium]|nr:aminotransferase class V-fold PLP-dependent enzyme [bacterium]